MSEIITGLKDLTGTQTARLQQYMDSIGDDELAARIKTVQQVTVTGEEYAAISTQVQFLVADAPEVMEEGSSDFDAVMRVLSGVGEHVDHDTSVHHYRVVDTDSQLLLLSVSGDQYCEECDGHSGYWLVELHPVDSNTRHLLDDTAGLGSSLREISARARALYLAPLYPLHVTGLLARIGCAEQEIKEIQAKAVEAERLLGDVKQRVRAGVPTA